MPKINEIIKAQFPEQIKRVNKKDQSAAPVRDFGETISDFVKNVKIIKFWYFVFLRFLCWKFSLGFGSFGF